MDSEAATHSAGTASSSRPSADPLLPVLPILDPTVPLDRQQCVLKATKEARAFHRPKGFQASAGPKDLQTACDEADTAMAPPPDPPQQPQTDPVPPSQVSFEGWHKQWESGPQGLPSADVKWLKEDADRGLFKNLTIARRKILKEDRMWFHPPEIPGVVVGGGVPSADAFFRSRVFFWRPVGVWGYSLRCPRSGCPGGKAAFLYRCGYGNTVRHICDMTGWYSMLTELLACNACRKAAKGSQEHSIGRFLAWDAAILKQLTPAHQALFPAILTPRHGVDKQVVRLMRDRTEGNTMVKVWRQVQEGHCEEYLQRKDLYTTLLCQLSRPGSIMSALGHHYQKPPTRRELPSPRLLRKAYLIYEAEHIELLDYRTRIMSTFGKVLEYDSTRKRPQSVTSTSLPPAAELPDERPHTSRPQVQYEVTPSLAGTRKRKVPQDNLTSAPQPQQSTTAAGLQPQPVFVFLPLRRPALPPQLLPPPVFLPPPALPQARSTLYKRKKKELGATRPQSKVQTHTCALCGQSTQGHIKYRKKTYCQKSKLSTSKGLTGKPFENITDFRMAVDELLASQSQAP
ncbi:uncharacterized protein LOC130405218 isoform X1 [Gadus chalcogrammus]|uniref:uncharacterized protein LOC130405218 isoform X1 n=1 Tax=Gadus chalcogrammus TaxID=1042646 RepID=UPI0024C4E3BA|nr:uncharacterized protein LOC130405218 isoform X1 [Gadus chalcogrammus]XP_056466225.1 uncharacterized protein LOC130405218 isoform X1 [Gadus chalcogrammus]